MRSTAYIVRNMKRCLLKMGAWLNEVNDDDDDDDDDDSEPRNYGPKQIRKLDAKNKMK